MNETAKDIFRGALYIGAAAFLVGVLVASGGAGVAAWMVSGHLFSGLGVVWGAVTSAHAITAGLVAGAVGAGVGGVGAAAIDAVAAVRRRPDPSKRRPPAFETPQSIEESKSRWEPTPEELAAASRHSSFQNRVNAQSALANGPHR